MNKVLLILILTAVVAAAADVAIIVTDQSGGAIPGARVVLRDAAGVELQKGVTEPAGRFSFSGLSAGNYAVRVEQAGFKAAIARVKVGAKAPAPLRIVLTIADLRQEVTVGGGGVLVNTDSGENMDVVKLDRKTLSGLPVLGNDIIGTAAQFLDSGALGATGISMVVDGMETSEKGVSASAIQEVRINQNPYSAEFGRPGRGRIEVITKPGTSEYHGEANFIFRDSIFDARNTFAETRPNEQRRVFEGNLTGPIGDGKKASFVLSGNHEAEDLESIVYARTPAGESRANVPQPARQSEFSAKITRQMGPKSVMAFRFEFSDDVIENQGVGGFDLPEVASNYFERQYHVYFNYRGTLSPRLVNELSVRAGRHNEVTQSLNPGVRKIVVNDAFTGGGGQADRHGTENHVQFTDTTLWTRGKHMLKFGISSPDLSRRAQNDFTNRIGEYDFSSLNDYTAGKPYTFMVQSGDGYLSFWQKEISFFAQDDIKLRPNLTMAVGLRYDWQNYLADHNNFAPRLSFAWSPDKNRKTVLRAGGGIFYDKTGAGATGDTLRYDGQHLRKYVITNPTYPDPLPPGISLLGQPANLVQFASNLRSAYLAQYTFGAERQLRKGLALTATYTGLRGTKLFRSLDVTAPVPPLYSGRPNPDIGVLRQIQSAGRLAGQSLEVALRET